MTDSQQPTGSGPSPDRSWRPQQSRRTVRAARKLKIVAASTFLLVLFATLCWLMFRGSDARLVTFIGIGRTDYGRTLPLNPGSWQDVESLTELFEAIHAERPEEVASRVDSSEHLNGRLLDFLNDACAGEGNFVVFCSLHADVVRDTGGAPELQLLVDADGTGIRFRELLATLESSAAKQIVLLLDASAQPDWDRGVLANDVMAQIRTEADGVKGRIAVICATDGSETSWASIAPEADGPAWQHQPGTIFGMAIHTAFASKQSDTNSNGVLELGELFDSVRDQCAPWNQTVTWLNKSQRRDAGLTITFPEPPAPTEAETSNVAESAKGDEKADGAEPVLGPTERLADLWRRRDAIWLSNANVSDPIPMRRGEVVAAHPTTWRRLNQELVLLEEWLRYDLHTQTRYAGDIAQRLTKVERDLESLQDSSGESNQFVPSLMWTTTEPDPALVAKFPGIVKALLAEQKKPDARPASPELPLTAASERTPFAAWMVDQLVQIPAADFADRLGEAGTVLAALNDRRGISWPREDWPVELLLVSELAGRFSSSELKENDSVTVQRVLRARLESNRMGGLLEPDSLRTEIHEHIQNLIETNSRGIVAAERWLLAGEMDQANSWLDSAEKSPEKSLANAKQRGEATRSLLQKREILLAEYADHVRWLATRLEFQGVAFDSNIKPGRSPSAAALIALAQDIQSIDKLLATDGSLSGRTVEKLIERADGNLKTLDRSLATYCSELAEASRWAEIDFTLRNPWLRAETRESLVESFRKRQPGQLVAKADTGRWQAFWGGKVASLALPESKELPDLDELPKRLKHGAELAARWSKLNTVLKQPGETDELTFDRCARLATRIPRDVDVEQGLLEKRNTLRRSLQTQIANCWVRRGGDYANVVAKAPAAVLDLSLIHI